MPPRQVLQGEITALPPPGCNPVDSGWDERFHAHQHESGARKNQASSMRTSFWYPQVKEGLNAHFVVARQHLDAIISRQLP
jgi:hypothetical protein